MTWKIAFAKLVLDIEHFHAKNFTFISFYGISSKSNTFLLRKWQKANFVFFFRQVCFALMNTYFFPYSILFRAFFLACMACIETLRVVSLCKCVYLRMREKIVSCLIKVYFLSQLDVCNYFFALSISSVWPT